MIFRSLKILTFFGNFFHSWSQCLQNISFRINSSPLCVTISTEAKFLLPILRKMLFGEKCLEGIPCWEIFREVGLLPRGELFRSNCSGVFSGGIIQGYYPGGKSLGGSCLVGNFIGKNCPGGSCPEGNYH